MHKINTRFKIGDVVSYMTENGYDIVTDQFNKKSFRYAEILSIKADKAGIFYQMTDCPIDQSTSRPSERWIPESKVVNVHVVAK